MKTAMLVPEHKHATWINCRNGRTISVPCTVKGTSALARGASEFEIYMPFSIGTSPREAASRASGQKRRNAGWYLAHVLEAHYSDAAFPYWRFGSSRGAATARMVWEGHVGLAIIEDLKPQEGGTSLIV